MMPNDRDEIDQPLSLLLFTRQFATLLSAGVPLLRCLHILQHEAPPPLVEVVKEMQQRVEAHRMLSEALQGRPEVFSPFYVKMVRVGEVGGILDETLAFLAEALEQEWRLSRLAPPEEPPPRLVCGGETLPHDWAALDEYQRNRVLLFFCWSLGSLLSAGVPIPLAVETAADLLPEAQRQMVRAVAQGDLGGGIAGPLTALGFLPVLVTELLAVGEHTALLHHMLEKAAHIYRHGLECALMYRHMQRQGR